MSASLDAALHGEIRALELRPDLPLLVVDADEVLVHFAEPLALWLAQRGWELRLTSYTLKGAIRRPGGGETPGATLMRALLDDFMDENTRAQPMVEGAAQSLAALEGRMQVVVLTNVPARLRAARVENLAGHGIGYPLLANSGPKGPALAALARRIEAPVTFIDDSPFQIESAARLAGSVRRVHFAASDILRAVMPEVPQADHALRSWKEVARLLA